MTRDFDLIVIAGRPAGICGANTAGLFGKRVALVEKLREVGGAGINTSTIPSRTLRETALNTMIDITTTRREAANIHSPLIIWVMLGALTFACALFAGYDMAGRRRLNTLHSLAFAPVLALTVYVIIDLEYPRIGLIQISDSDKVLIDLRESMK